LLAVADSVATVALVAVAAPYGLLIATGAYAFRPFATLPLATRLARAKCGIAARTVLSPQMPALVAALAMGALVWTLGEYLQVRSSESIVLLVQILAGILSYPVLYLVLSPKAASAPARALLERLRGLTSKSP
jgi:hypothetical protein